MIISGCATLRTPNGLEIVKSGDLIFFEKGKTGAHQLYNHTTETCIYLDIRTYKIFIAPAANNPLETYRNEIGWHTLLSRKQP